MIRVLFLKQSILREQLSAVIEMDKHRNSLRVST